MTGFEVMKSFIGTQEYKDRAKLMEFFKKHKLMSPEHPNEVFNPDGKMQHGLPWCAVMVSACEKEAGNNCTYRTAAIDFNTYGTKIGTSARDLPSAKEGDILIFTRKGGNHVGYFAGLKDGFIRVLGGNQSDSVSYAYYDKARLIGIRRP